MDPEAMVVLLNYRDDGTTPYLVFFKDGLKVEKVVCFLQLFIMLMGSKRCLSDVFLFLFVMEVVMYVQYYHTFRPSMVPLPLNRAYIKTVMYFQFLLITGIVPVTFSEIKEN